MMYVRVPPSMYQTNIEDGPHSLAPWWPPPDSAQWHSAPIFFMLYRLTWKCQRTTRTDSHHCCFEFKFPWPLLLSLHRHSCRQGTLPMSQIDRAFVAHLPGLKGQSWGYIHLMETVEYASTCPRKNLEDCGALLNLGVIMAVNDRRKESDLKFQVAESLS